MTYRPILAKSPERGGTTLVDHIEHVRIASKTIAQKLGWFEDDIIAVEYGAILHDIGKVHTEFQDVLYGIHHETIEMPLFSLRHEISSLLFLECIPESYRSRVVEMVVSHHKSVGIPNVEPLGTKGLLYLIDAFGSKRVFARHSFGIEQWSMQALAILTQFSLDCISFSVESAQSSFEFAIQHCESLLNNYTPNKWKGILVAGDHLASALVYNTGKNLERLFQSPDTSILSNEPNSLYPLSQVDTSSQKKHTLVTAPTGAGKTDFLLRRCRSRIFYTLPFQASINAMFERCCKEFSHFDVRVLHAASSFTLENGSYEEKVLQDKVGASVKVLTPHQLAGIVVGTRGYETTILDIQECDVILDEIHCYSDKTQALVLEIVRALLYFGCRIHIGSATMPSILKEKLLELLGGSEDVLEVSLTEEQLITFNRHQIYKVSTFDDTNDVIDKSLEENKKVLIVCNRVQTSQEKFQYFQQKYPSIPILLLHSKFKRGDRVNIEKELMVLNKSSEPCIVISTQVVEVSLDISFDCMISEAAPLDAMIQRFGRINRKRTANTIGKYKPIYVIQPPDSIKDCKPYDADIIQSSFAILPSNGSILQESELQTMIDTVFDKIDFKTIKSFSIWSDGRILLPSLCHYSKSKLMELLDIDSQAVIFHSEVEQYRTSPESRNTLEVTISSKAMFNKSFQSMKIEQLSIGSRPFVLPDVVYSKEIGLVLNKQIENILYG